MLSIESTTSTTTFSTVFRRLVLYCPVLQENRNIDYSTAFERVDVGVTLCRSSATTKSI